MDQKNSEYGHFSRSDLYQQKSSFSLTIPN